MAKIVSSAEKVIASVFWKAKGILLIDLKKEKTVSGQYYGVLLEKVKTDRGKTFRNGQEKVVSSYTVAFKHCCSEKD